MNYALESSGLLRISWSSNIIGKPRSIGYKAEHPLDFTASRNTFTSPPHAGQARMLSGLTLRPGLRFCLRAFVIKLFTFPGRNSSPTVVAVRFTEVSGDSSGTTIRLRARGSSRLRGDRSRISISIVPSHSYSIQNISGSDLWKRANQGLYS